MTYATQDDMVKRFGETELAQRTNRVDGSSIDAVVLTRAIGDAEAEINGYLAVRYQLPLSELPSVLVRVACDIARYHLYDDGVPETVRTRYQDSVSLLKRMSSGEVQLAGGSPIPVASGGRTVASKSPARVFSNDVLSKF